MAILGTTALRREYGPPCSGPFARIKLNGAGAIHVQPRCATAFQALNACLTAWGYETRRDDTGAYVCRAITGGTGYSLHAYAIASDINWQTNPYGKKLITDMPSGMVRAIKAIRTISGRQVFGWGGDYRTNKDAMHFEIVCPRADLETGINAATVPGGNHTPQPDPIAPPAQPKGFLMALSDAEQDDLYNRIKRIDQNAANAVLEGRKQQKSTHNWFRAVGEQLGIKLGLGGQDVEKRRNQFMKD